ncbi:hypothetical protein BAOM_3032 [Peribacillus asahii]|uniref:Uncharacterized protein n=1 Tax=Peribacillus asahii TaxID=228899 RepID=A0A3T0KTW9_9BACI|nr:hypothetical protein [Peribacillus asahii]AZV43641.1 hypothetical protein BAOM_3032 [Peribacillus asahii]
MENQRVFELQPLTEDQKREIREIMGKLGFKTDDNYIELDTKEIKF